MWFNSLENHYCSNILGKPIISLMSFQTAFFFLYAVMITMRIAARCLQFFLQLLQIDWFTVFHHFNWEIMLDKWQQSSYHSTFFWPCISHTTYYPSDVMLGRHFPNQGHVLDEINSALFRLSALAYFLWLPNGVKAYQKPHQSLRLSAAFMGCWSASWAVVTII